MAENHLTKNVLNDFRLENFTSGDSFDFARLTNPGWHAYENYENKHLFLQRMSHVFGLRLWGRIMEYYWAKKKSLLWQIILTFHITLGAT